MHVAAACGALVGFAEKDANEELMSSTRIAHRLLQRPRISRAVINPSQPVMNPPEHRQSEIQSSCRRRTFLKQSHRLVIEAGVVAGQPSVKAASMTAVARCRHSRRNTIAAMTVGKNAPANNPIGKIAPSKKRPSSAWPAGFGAFAITVNPPPTTAP
jgi:hypothetical protein